MLRWLRLRRGRGPVDLAVGMAGVRLGERVLQAGVGLPRAFAIMAGKAGLTGRACAVVDATAAAATLESAAAGEGVLIEVAVALLDRQLQAQAKAFEREGGFTERLYRTRTSRRRGQ